MKKTTLTLLFAVVASAIWAEGILSHPTIQAETNAIPTTVKIVNSLRRPITPTCLQFSSDSVSNFVVEVSYKLPGEISRVTDLGTFTNPSVVTLTNDIPIIPFGVISFKYTPAEYHIGTNVFPKPNISAYLLYK